MITRQRLATGLCALLAALAHETSGLRMPEAAAIPAVTSGRGAATVDPDWPFLAF